MGERKHLLGRIHKRQEDFSENIRARQRLQFFGLQREPTTLDEFEWEKYPALAIRRENETIICICYCPFSLDCEEVDSRSDLARSAFYDKSVRIHEE